MRASALTRGVGRFGPPLRARDRGSAVVETAIAIPCLIAVGVALLWGLGIGTTMLSLSDAAHQAARAVARGASPDEVAQLAAQAAPQADVRVQQGDALVQVALSQQVSLPIPILDGYEVTVSRSATAAREDLPPW